MGAAMKGFVVTKLFQPSTRARGIAAYRLLKGSDHYYYVLFVKDPSYTEDFRYCDNIAPLPLEESEEKWIEEGVKYYSTLNKIEKIDFIFTMSMPPEDHKIGLAIKERFPGIPWVAFFSDPIYNNPLNIIKMRNNKVNEDKINQIELENKNYQDTILTKADLLLFPDIRMAEFMSGEKYDTVKMKIEIIPHSFDDYLPAKPPKSDGCTTITYAGRLYGDRTIEELVKGVALLDKRRGDLLGKLKINIIGKVNDINKKLVAERGLDEIFNFVDEMPFEDLKKFLVDADMLLSLDPKMIDGQANMFKPSKIADYMSAKRPILLITDNQGASADFADLSNNMRCVNDGNAIAEKLDDILNGKINIINLEYYDNFKTELVSRRMDNAILKIVNV